MELFFSNTYNESNLFLLEIPEQVYEDYIVKSEDRLIIKGTDPTVLCTNNKSFELKFLETSNTYMVLDSEKESDLKKEIVLMAYHTVVCDDLSPKKYHVYNLLKVNSALSYDIQTGSSNFNQITKRYTKEDCFALSALPKTKFEAFLNQQYIFEKEGYMFVFDTAFVNGIVPCILKSIAYGSQEDFESIDAIYAELQKFTNEYDKVIANLSFEEKKMLVLYVFDYNHNYNANSNNDGGSMLPYSLSLKKSLLLLSQLVFVNKSKSTIQLTVNSFISELQMFYNLCLPLQTINSLMESMETYLQSSTCQDNLFEYYKEYDFRYLIGHCVLYMTKGSKEVYIKWIDVPSLAEKFEERIAQLFEIKDKWTIKEINVFMSNLEISNLHEKVSRVTQSVTEVNPFNNEKQITYLYYKKNPFFKK